MYFLRIYLILGLIIPLLIDAQWLTGNFYYLSINMKNGIKDEKIRVMILSNTPPEFDPLINIGVPSFATDTIKVDENQSLENSKPDTGQAEIEDDLLNEFREAFEKMVKSENDSVNEEKQQQAERNLLLELDGMVIDDTRSRTGRDFYDLFYQKWQAPEKASNYTIRISERPTPTLGSIVTVKVNDDTIFQYRLQPRYSIIEEAAMYAVRVTREYLETSQKEYKIY